MGLKNRFLRFMQGRYGADSLYNFLMTEVFILIFINLFLGRYFISLFIYAAQMIIFGYALFRFFSKNIYKRSLENQKFLRIKGKVIGFFKLRASMYRDRKSFIYRKCPKCKAVLRLPKKKGKHTAVCPSCKNRFGVRVR